jgi:hypothetical protein
MTSAFTAYLPLLGALLGAVVGGFVGAFANGWIRDRQERKAQHREREGLMVLIGAEVRGNKIAFGIRNSPQSIADNLSTAAWEQSRTRLAQMIPPKEIERLAAYYDTIRSVKGHWKDDIGNVTSSHDATGIHLMSACDRMAAIVKKYVGDFSF